MQRDPDQASICDELGVRMCGRKHCFCCVNVQHKCAEIAGHKASHKSHLWQHTHTWCHTSVQTSHPQLCGAVKDRLCLPLVISVKQLSHLSTVTHTFCQFFVGWTVVKCPGWVMILAAGSDFAPFAETANQNCMHFKNCKIYLASFIHSPCQFCPCVHYYNWHKTFLYGSVWWSWFFFPLEDFSKCSKYQATVV